MLKNINPFSNLNGKSSQTRHRRGSSVKFAENPVTEPLASTGNLQSASATLGSKTKRASSWFKPAGRARKPSLVINTPAATSVGFTPAHGGRPSTISVGSVPDTVKAARRDSAWKHEPGWVVPPPKSPPPGTNPAWDNHPNRPSNFFLDFPEEGPGPNEPWLAERRQNRNSLDEIEAANNSYGPQATSQPLSTSNSSNSQPRRSSLAREYTPHGTPFHRMKGEKDHHRKFNDWRYECGIAVEGEEEDGADEGYASGAAEEPITSRGVMGKEFTAPSLVESRRQTPHATTVAEAGALPSPLTPRFPETRTGANSQTMPSRQPAHRRRPSDDVQTVNPTFMLPLNPSHSLKPSTGTSGLASANWRNRGTSTSLETSTHEASYDLPPLHSWRGRTNATAVQRGRGVSIASSDDSASTGSDSGVDLRSTGSTRSRLNYVPATRSTVGAQFQAFKFSPPPPIPTAHHHALVPMHPPLISVSTGQTMASPPFPYPQVLVPTATGNLFAAGFPPFPPPPGVDLHVIYAQIDQEASILLEKLTSYQDRVDHARTMLASFQSAAYVTQVDSCMAPGLEGAPGAPAIAPDKMARELVIQGALRVAIEKRAEIKASLESHRLYQFPIDPTTLDQQRLAISRLENTIAAYSAETSKLTGERDIKTQIQHWNWILMQMNGMVITLSAQLQHAQAKLDMLRGEMGRVGIPQPPLRMLMGRVAEVAQRLLPAPTGGSYVGSI